MKNDEFAFHLLKSHPTKLKFTHQLKIYSGLCSFYNRDNLVEYIRFVGFHDVASHYHFVNYKVCFLYVEHNLIQESNIGKNLTSSSQTFSKYLSNVSTKLCMNSSRHSSFCNRGYKSLDLLCLNPDQLL